MSWIKHTLIKLPFVLKVYCGIKLFLNLFQRFEFLILLALLYFKIYSRIHIFFRSINRVHFVWKVDWFFLVHRKYALIPKFSFFKTVTNLCCIQCLFSQFLSLVWLLLDTCNALIFLIVQNVNLLIVLALEFDGECIFFIYLREKTVVIVILLIVMLSFLYQFHFCLFFYLKNIIILFIFVEKSVFCYVESRSLIWIWNIIVDWLIFQMRILILVFTCITCIVMCFLSDSFHLNL